MFREQSAFLSAGMLLLVLACMLVPTLAAHEGERPCLHCHRHADCTKVCRLVCEEKKVEVTLWGCETEEFCVPGPKSSGKRTLCNGGFRQRQGAERKSQFATQEVCMD